MNLEDAIKQKTFKSEFHKLEVNLLYTGAWALAKSNADLKNFGLTVQQYNVLRILRGQHPDPASVNLIIDRMLDKMSNASRLVDKLQKKELVIRSRCKKDRRQVDVTITVQGLQLLEKIDRHLEKVIVSNNLTEAEARELNRLLDKVRG